MKRKSRQTLDITVSTKSVFFFKFHVWVGGCSPAAPPPNRLVAEHLYLHIFRMTKVSLCEMFITLCSHIWERHKGNCSIRFQIRDTVSINGIVHCFSWPSAGTC